MKSREWGPSSQRGDFFGLMATGDVGSVYRAPLGWDWLPQDLHFGDPEALSAELSAFLKPKIPQNTPLKKKKSSPYYIRMFLPFCPVKLIPAPGAESVVTLFP